MLFYPRRRAARVRAVALLSAGAVVAGLLGAVPVATAEPSSKSQAAGAQTPVRQLGAGRYVVVLREPGARWRNTARCPSG